MKAWTWFGLYAAVTAAAACGSGESSDNATAACNEQRQRQAQCFTNTSFDDCVSCREKCGRKCVQVLPETCPISFECK